MSYKNPLVANAGEIDMPGYDTIFGKLDFKKGDEARSVYSPAAYLADMLQIMHDEFDATAPVNTSFEQRRPDIKNIILDAENTFGIIPYLDIVNEILEKEIGPDPYTTLKTGAFPMNLPFDLQNERIKLCLQYLDVTAEQVYKVFAVNHLKEIIAREYLALSADEVKVILGSSGGTLLEKYGNPSSMTDILNVENFLIATKLTGLELRELLFQNLDEGERGEVAVDGTTYHLQTNFFVNKDLNGFATLDDTEENIVWSSGTAVPDAWFERVHRLIRLSKKTGISLTDLDLMLRDLCGHTLDDNAIVKVAVVQRLVNQYDLKVDEVCAFFHTLNSTGYGSDELEPADLFNRLFNGKHTTFSKKYIAAVAPKPQQYDDAEFSELTYTGDILGVDNNTYKKRIYCALGIGDKALSTIVTKFRMGDSDETIWNTPAQQLTTLTVLYRLSKLTEILDSSYEEIMNVFDILAKDPDIRNFDNFDTFIHFPVTEPDCYKIITGSDIEASMWLIQTLAAVLKWMQKVDITGEELKMIAAGDYSEKIILPGTLESEKKVKTKAETDKEEKIAALDNFYQQYKVLFFEKGFFVSPTFDNRTAGIIYKAMLESPELVSQKDKRIVFFNEAEARDAAYRSIHRLDLITRDDFKGLGIEEKIAQKIFNNLVWKGYLNTDGSLNEEMMATAAEESFDIDTDFSAYKQQLFDLIRELHTGFVDVSIFPSDLQKLELSEAQANELYDNLILNGYLDDNGNLLEPVTFEDEEYISSFEVNANIGSYSEIGNYGKDVLDHIRGQVRKFESCEIRLNKDIFESLPLNEMEIDDLIENLRFNEYLEEEEDIFTDNLKMLEMDIKEFNLALQFYPLRHSILNAIKDLIGTYKARYYTVKQELFKEVSENINADWIYKAMTSAFLADGRLEQDQREFFKNRENAKEFDIWWSFDTNDNLIVFNAIRDIVLNYEQYMFTDTALKEWNFNQEEIDELINRLRTDGWLNQDNKIPVAKLDFFLNIDNALVFSIEAFEDYNKDVFFLLSAIAMKVKEAVQSIIDRMEELAGNQEESLYVYLQDAFGLNSEDLKIISNQVFKGKGRIIESWLLPVISAVNPLDIVDAEPADYKFNAAYRRIRQFAMLASKLKLSGKELEIAFSDQSLVDKFPENITLPNGITSLDALLETDEGVYIFKDTACWLFDATSYEIIEKEDKSARTLSDISELLKGEPHIDAAFTDNKGNSVIIAAEKYLIREKDSTIWKLKEDHEWGKVTSDFENPERIDAALTDAEGRTYLFSGNQYVRYSGTSFTNVDDGYPKEIAGNWSGEEVTASLHDSFKTGLDAAFHGLDKKTYIFKDHSYVCSDNMSEVMPINEKWGLIENNFSSAEKIDAAYNDGGSQYFFSGDQVIAYDDSIENIGVVVSEGYPKKIKDHFTNIPSQFHQDLDAAFKDADGKIVLFKDDEFVRFDASSINVTAVKIADSINGWGKIDNPLASSGAIDAAFTGLDGRTYLFSGDQYFRYSGEDYSAVDPGFPCKTANDWSSLTSIDAAFVMDGKTYIFGKDSATDKALYLRFSGNDYTVPDEGYPKEQNDNWWNLPFSLTGHEIEESGFKKVDAVCNTMSGKTYLFSGDKVIYYDHMHRWWSEPETFSQKWDKMAFTHIDAAFTGKDGKTYLFSGSKYVRFSDTDLTGVDNGYPRTTATMFGNVKNNILANARVDAAMMLTSNVEEETVVNGEPVTNTVQYTHTYLFSGEQYVRYTGNNYSEIESGYPKLIKESLKEEPRFKDIHELEEPPEFDENGKKIEKPAVKVTIPLPDMVDAAFADERNIYLFSGLTCHVYSESLDKKYDTAALPHSGCVFMDQASIFTEEAGTWSHVSGLEGGTIVKSPANPSWLTDAPAQFRTGLNAVLYGTDNNTYLFKGSEVFDLQLENIVEIKEEWGRLPNNIYTNNTVDAAFAGTDGKTYVFSGHQFVEYEDGITDYINTKLEDAPKPVSEKWKGLETVDIAYVFDGKTYLFQKTGDNNYLCLRYSGKDYSVPDSGYPITTGLDFWGIPQKYIDEGFDSIDAVLIDKDEMLFISGDKYLETDVKEAYWSYPKRLDNEWKNVAWPDFPRCDEGFEGITAAFTGFDGTIYFFKHKYFTSFSSNQFTAPAEIKDHWGMVQDILENKVDAAIVHRGFTYLFSGAKYVRYSRDDYRFIDEGYPKFIVGNLRKEEGFENLPEEFDAHVNELVATKGSTMVDAVVSNPDNVYIHVHYTRTGYPATWYVFSSSINRDFNIGTLGHIKNNFTDNNTIDAALVNGIYTYLFSGDQYIRYSGDKYEFIDPGYPKAIAGNLAIEGDFNAVPEHFNKDIDAAFKADGGNIYLFKDLKFYDSGNDSAGAQDIKGVWGAIQNNFTLSATDKSIDAAIIGPLGELYVFKGNQYIRYSDPQQEYIDAQYPKIIDGNWGNLPADFESALDGAFNFEGNTYFVKGSQFVKYIDHNYRFISSIYPQVFVDRWADLIDYHLFDLRVISRFKRLQDSFSGEYTLVDLLHKGSGYVKLPDDMLADIFNFDVEEVKWFKRHNAFLDQNNPRESYVNLELVIDIYDALSLSGKMGATISGLYKDIWREIYLSPAGLEAAADALIDLLSTSGCKSGQLDILTGEIHDRMNELKRDALVPYVIHSDDSVENARDLYEKLLIDVQMGSCGKTSKIKEALSAVQLFFHRYFINLEEIDLRNADEEERRLVLKERWKWMRNYRVWEANRKVFLYPENYIRPELRDTKTPSFKTLEDDLTQGEITPVATERVFKKYLDEYTEVSRLKIAGGYVYQPPGSDPGTNKLVLFGRTKTDPKRFYYRTAEFLPGEGDSSIWEPWLNVNIKIDADRVYPVYAFEKVFVFWPVLEVKTDESSAESIQLKKDDSDNYKVDAPKRTRYQIKIYFSFYNLNKEWIPPQVLKTGGQSEVVIRENGPISEIKLYVETSNNLQGSGGSFDYENIVISCTYRAQEIAWTPTDKPVVYDIYYPPSPPYPWIPRWVYADKSASFRLTPELYSQPTTKPNFDPNGKAVVNALLQETPEVEEDAIVMFNGAEESSDGPWFSFDHKGGSFLCKPNIITVEADAWPKILANNTDDLPPWPQIDAAFYYNGKSWFFRNDTKKYVTSANIGVEIDISDDWGRVLIPSATIGQIDSALNDGTKTYLFVGDQYYRHTNYESTDDMEALSLNNNSEGFPKWDHIDAAFKGKDGKSYFFRNSDGKFIVSGSSALQDIKTFWGLVQNAFTDPTDSTPVTTAFTSGSHTYLVKSNQFIRYTGSSFNTVDTGYPKQGNSDELLTDLGFGDLQTALTDKGIKAVKVEGDTVYVATTDGIYRKGVKANNVTTWTQILKADFPKVIFQTDDKVFSKDLDNNTQLTYQDVDNTGTPTGPVKTFSFNEGSTTMVIDAIFVADDGFAYIFSGQAYMKSDKNLFNGNSINWNEEGKIYDDWGKAASNILSTNTIDAAFVRDDQTFLFSGDEYVRYTGSDYSFIDSGYPMKIASNTDNLPAWTHMDAALGGSDGVDYFFDISDGTYVSSQDLTTKKPTDDKFAVYFKIYYETVDATYIDNGKLFLTSGDQYYRYTYQQADSKWTMDNGYPKQLKLYGLDPVKVDAAYTLNDITYLFSGERYYKLTAGQEPNSNPRPYFIQGNWANIPSELRSGIDAALMNADDLYFFKNMNGSVQYIKYEGVSNPDNAAPGEVQDSKYNIIRLTSSTAYKLNQRLFAGGIDSLLQLSTQAIDELPGFTKTGSSDPITIKVNSNKVDKLPVSTHLDFNSANGIYYWEVFYHAPALIANALNTAQKFEEAKQWYEYIFDPTEPGAYWKFLPFLAVDIDAIIQGIKDLMEQIEELDASITLPSFDALADRLDDYTRIFQGSEELTEAQLTAFKTLPASSELTGFFNAIQNLYNSANAKIKDQLASILEILEIAKRLPDRYELLLNNTAQIKTYLDDPFDPHAIASLRRIAYRRTVVMAYIDNLIDWGDMLFTRYTVESINEARMLYILAYDLLGRKPENTGDKVLSDAVNYQALRYMGAEQTSTGVYDFLFDLGDGTTNDQSGAIDRSLTYAGTIHDTVASDYFFIPENSLLLEYWDRIEDRLHKIRHCLNIMGVSQPLPLFQPPIDPMALVNAVAGGGGLDAALAQMSMPVPHYRFTSMMNRAKELAGKLNQFGGDLLGAIEKKDSEELSLLQNKQELSILNITSKIREAQLKEAETNLENLKAMRASAEMQKNTYESWMNMLPQEETQIGMMIASAVLHFITPFLKLGAGIANIVPDIKIGSPFSMGATTGGSTIGAALGFIAEAVESISEGLSMGGEIAGIYAQFIRSQNDWKLQQAMAIEEMKQLDIQIQGAKYAIKSAQLELKSTEKEIENNESMTTFMKEKFSNMQLYQWMAQKLSGMFFQTYKIAHDMAKAAERAFIFERGVKESDVNFIGGAYWDSAKKGLLAGEQLGLDLDRMEKAYVDTDARGFEITKRISLMEINPMALLQLKEKGICQFDFTEALFDYDFQGHYNRQIKTISLELAAGEGETVNATLTQLRNRVVMEPDAKAVKYLLNPKDEQPLSIRSDWRPGQQIVLSHVGEYDENNGMFELRYDDERYLPFEGTGAVSGWRLQLNGKKGSFDVNQLADVIIKIRYTADQGGEDFAAAVKGMLKPYPAAVLFNISEMFPNEWYAFTYDDTDDLQVTITREMFPNMSGSKISGVYSAYTYNQEGQATLKLGEELELKHNKLVPAPGLTIGAKGETWTFTAKGNKRALENMVLVLSYKAVVE